MQIKNFFEVFFFWVIDNWQKSVHSTFSSFIVVVSDEGLFKTVLKLMFRMFSKVLNTPYVDMVICQTNLLLSDKNPD